MGTRVLTSVAALFASATSTCAKCLASSSWIETSSICPSKGHLVSALSSIWQYWASNAEMLNYRFNIQQNKPVMITEFGADALGGYHADADTRWSEEYQDTLYKNQFKMLAGIPGLRGLVPWILVDFRSPRRQNPYFQDGWNRKGLISDDGKKKQAFWTMKTYYDEVRKRYESK